MAHNVSRAPLIGVTTKHGQAEWVEKNTHNYLAMLRELGATPVLLSPDEAALLPYGTAYLLMLRVSCPQMCWLSWTD